MLSLSPALAAHLAAPVTSLALCWRVTRRDGVSLGFTTHDQTLVIDGARYRPAPSFLPSQIAAGSGLNVDNMEIEGVLSDSAIREADLLAGRYDLARIAVFLVNWADPPAGRIVLQTGTLGEVRAEDARFTAEMRGLKQALQQPVGAVFSPECRADLGDRQCRVALRDFTVMSQVAAVEGTKRMRSALGFPDGWFHYGRLLWLGGGNAGLEMDVSSDSAGVLALQGSLAAPIEIGDRFQVEAGCDKRFVTCRDKFANGENFRGEPFVPGVDSLLDYPGLQ
ncbi:MAG: DUF2163 domain-containing protein [Pseudomonadota bacterium]